MSKNTIQIQQIITLTLTATVASSILPVNLATLKAPIAGYIIQYSLITVDYRKRII